MAPVLQPLRPNTEHAPIGIRKIHIQNLIDLLQACLLRGEIQRATRAWSILIRCREVDWRSRWRWGLAILTAGDTSSLQAGDDVDVAKWLRTLRVTVPSDEKPTVLHALILHLIRHSQYQDALDELETYLTSYPYLLSGTLHTYAGMLAFYLAQPESLRFSAIEGRGSVDGIIGLGALNPARRDASEDDSDTSSVRHKPTQAKVEPPNASLMRQARGWFVKALEIGKDEVAAEFNRLIDDSSSNRSAELSDDEEDDDMRPYAGSQSRRQFHMREPTLHEMLHPPSDDSDDDDEDGSAGTGENDEDEMVDVLHEDE